MSVVSRDLSAAQPETPLAGASSMGDVVRAARPEDLSRLAELVREEVAYAQRLAGYYQLLGNFDWLGFTKRKLNGPARCVIVAEQAGCVVGFIDLRLHRFAPLTRARSLFDVVMRRRRASAGMPLQPMVWGTIEACFVTDGCRRRGVGRALVSAGMAWFEQAGIRRVELGVLAANSAVVFWESLGFRTWRLQMYSNLGDGDPERLR